MVKLTIYGNTIFFKKEIICIIEKQFGGTNGPLPQIIQIPIQSKSRTPIYTWALVDFFLPSHNFSSPSAQCRRRLSDLLDNLRLSLRSVRFFVEFTNFILFVIQLKPDSFAFCVFTETDF